MFLLNVSSQYHLNFTKGYTHQEKIRLANLRDDSPFIGSTSVRHVTDMVPGIPGRHAQCLLRMLKYNLYDTVALGLMEFRTL